MKKVIVIVGREDRNGLNTEHYSLLVDREFASFSYDRNTGNHSSFLDMIGNAFGEKVVSDGTPLELGILNGYRLDSRTHKLVKIDGLNQVIADYLSSQIVKGVVSRAQEKRMLVIPIGDSRN